jgi:hypothetical protein
VNLAAGQPVAVLGYAADGWAQVELADGTQVWVEPDAVSPIGSAATAASPASTQAAAAAASASAAAASAASAVAAWASAETGVLVGTAERHPPPAAPGTEVPVQVAGVRLTTQLFGGALIMIAAFLPWTSQFDFTSNNAFGVPLRGLVDPADPFSGSTEDGFLKLAFLLVPLGVLVLVAGLRVVPPVVGQAAGGVAALVTVLFVLQLQRVMGKFYAATVFGVLGIGVYVAVLGGLVAAVSRGAEARS